MSLRSWLCSVLLFGSVSTNASIIPSPFARSAVVPINVVRRAIVAGPAEYEKVGAALSALSPQDTKFVIDTALALAAHPAPWRRDRDPRELVVHLLLHTLRAQFESALFWERAHERVGEVLTRLLDDFIRARAPLGDLIQAMTEGHLWGPRNVEFFGRIVRTYKTDVYALAMYDLASRLRGESRAAFARELLSPRAREVERSIAFVWDLGDVEATAKWLRTLEQRFTAAAPADANLFPIGAFTRSRPAVDAASLSPASQVVATAMSEVFRRYRAGEQSAIAAVHRARESATGPAARQFYFRLVNGGFAKFTLAPVAREASDVATVGVVVDFHAFAARRRTPGCAGALSI